AVAVARHAQGAVQRHGAPQADLRLTLDEACDDAGAVAALPAAERAVEAPRDRNDVGHERIIAGPADAETGDRLVRGRSAGEVQAPLSHADRAEPDEQQAADDARADGGVADVEATVVSRLCLGCDV